ncbi:MAG: hypothetical protein M3O29_02935 [Actinomycetota bacterium]|nr:hypothetical protein [Actinomycetota bacterium]
MPEHLSSLVRRDERSLGEDVASKLQSNVASPIMNVLESTITYVPSSTWFRN